MQHAHFQMSVASSKTKPGPEEAMNTGRVDIALFEESQKEYEYCAGRAKERYGSAAIQTCPAAACYAAAVSYSCSKTST